MIKKKLSPILTILFLAIFAYYFFNHIESFRPLLEISAWALAGVALTKMAIHFTNGLFMKWTVEVFTGRLALFEGVYVAILSATGNFFGPLLGGTTVRAIYLKRRHHLPYSYFTSTLAGYYLILFAVNAALALVALMALGELPYRLSLAVFFGGWLAALVLMMVLKLPRRERFKRIETKRYARFILNAFYEIETGWQRLKKAPRMLPRLSLLAATSFAITLLSAYIEFKAIGVSISLPALGIYTAISTSSMLIALTPGAIGIRESLLLLVSSAMQVSGDQILQVSLIDRGVSFLVLALLYVTSRWLKSTKLLPEAATKATKVNP